MSACASGSLRSLRIPAPKILSPPYGAYDRATVAVMRRLRTLMVSWSVHAPPAIVHGLRRRGFKVVTVPRMMQRDPPR